MTSTLMAVQFDPPLVNPAPNGLFAATQWQPQDGPLRWLPSGVDFRVFNYGGDSAYGVWTADWCVSEEDLDPQDDLKTGTRPSFPDAFAAFTSWAYDQCDLSEASQAEVLKRAEQVHRLQEPNAVETELAARLLTDAGTPAAAVDIVAAVGILEGQLAETNTLGLIHAGAQWAATAVSKGVAKASGGGMLKSPLGHTWVFGGGYVAALENKLVATSPVFGWRGDVQVLGAPATDRHNVFKAVAERSLVIGYEAAVGAAAIS